MATTTVIAINKLSLHGNRFSSTLNEEHLAISEELDNTRAELIQKIGTIPKNNS